MSFETEWAQCKRQASENIETQTNLAHAADDGSRAETTSPSPNVRSSKAAWTTASESVGGLCKNIRTALNNLEDGQKGLGNGDQAGATQSGPAQRDVYASWKRYLEDVSGRCDTLRGRMAKAGRSHHGNDDNVHGIFAGLAEKYKDTPGLGGEERGR